MADITLPAAPARNAGLLAAVSALFRHRLLSHGKVRLALLILIPILALTILLSTRSFFFTSVQLSKPP